MEAVRTKLLVLAGLVVAGMAAAGCDRASDVRPGPTSTTVQAAPSTTLAAPRSWPEHTSAAGGFRLRYPPGWRVTESTGSGGVALSLLPPQGDGITVLTTSTEPPPPATPCTPVRVGRLEGSRCQDTDPGHHHPQGARPVVRADRLPGAGGRPGRGLRPRAGQLPGHLTYRSLG